MPELPEVETIVRTLREGGVDRPSILGRVITASQVLWGRTLAEPGVEEFQKRILGQEIKEIGRKGKFLVFHLSVDTLLIHLRMSGDLLVEEASGPMAVHHRLTLELDDGRRLAFNDARKFGRVWLTNNPQDIFKDLGPEPLDEGLSWIEFHQRLRGFRRQIKPLLLDQSFIAGLGNIYTDEALFLAQLHPLSLSDQITEHQAERLLTCIRQVLREGIRHNGASLDWVYRGGNFQNYFRVYQRTGEACLVCGTAIERIVIGQRGTHYCPVCQKG